VRIVRNVPWWGLVSSAAAPVLLVGGWSGAARLQPQPVDPVTDTVSALAAVGAADRWAMTLTFAVVGICYIVTGIALRPAGPAGRLILAAGAAAGMLVAVNPQPAHGGSPAHALWASVGIAALGSVTPRRAVRHGVPSPGRREGSRHVVVALFAFIGTTAVAKRAFARRDVG
jgi:uncharacterized protein DUF998